MSAAAPPPLSPPSPPPPPLAPQPRSTTAARASSSLDLASAAAALRPTITRVRRADGTLHAESRGQPVGAWGGEDPGVPTKDTSAEGKMRRAIFSPRMQQANAFMSKTSPIAPCSRPTPCGRPALGLSRCGRPAWCGRPARAAHNRGWPKLGAAWSTIWRRRRGLRRASWTRSEAPCLPHRPTCAGAALTRTATTCLPSRATALSGGARRWSRPVRRRSRSCTGQRG